MIDYDRLKDSLKKERDLLVEELRRISKKSPTDPGGWTPKKNELDIDPANNDEVADALEDIGERIAIESELEKRLIEVESAINRIGNGTYGVCETCGSFIEAERLEANPAARTCKAHKG